MKYIFKILFFTVIVSSKIFSIKQIKYIDEKDMLESTNNKFFLYGLQINNNSMINCQKSEKNKMVMLGKNYVYFAFKYNKGIFIACTHSCKCCFNNCYFFLDRNNFVEYSLLPEQSKLKVKFNSENKKSISYKGKNLFMCNEYLKYRSNIDSNKNKMCNFCCLSSSSNNNNNNPITFSNQKIGKEELCKMIFIIDNGLENNGVTLDLCENVKIIDEPLELNIIAKKTDKEMKKLYESKSYIEQ